MRRSHRRVAIDELATSSTSTRSSSAGKTPERRHPTATTAPSIRVQDRETVRHQGPPPNRAHNSSRAARPVCTVAAASPPGSGSMRAQVELSRQRQPRWQRHLVEGSTRHRRQPSLHRDAARRDPRHPAEDVEPPSAIPIPSATRRTGGSRMTMRPVSPPTKPPGHRRQMIARSAQIWRSPPRTSVSTRTERSSARASREEAELQGARRRSSMKNGSAIVGKGRVAPRARGRLRVAHRRRRSRPETGKVEFSATPPSRTLAQLVHPCLCRGTDAGGSGPGSGGSTERRNFSGMTPGKMLNSQLSSTTACRWLRTCRCSDHATTVLSAAPLGYSFGVRGVGEVPNRPTAARGRQRHLPRDGCAASPTSRCHRAAYSRRRLAWTRSKRFGIPALVEGFRPASRDWRRPSACRGWSTRWCKMWLAQAQACVVPSFRASLDEKRCSRDASRRDAGAPTRVGHGPCSPAFRFILFPHRPELWR